MGAGIAQVAALSGFEVVLIDMSKELVDNAQAGIAKRLGRDVERERVSAEDRDAALARIKGDDDWKSLSGLAEVDVVIEAIVEDLGIKNQVFEQLGSVCKPGALIASNTSSLPVSNMAAAGGRPERVVGLHFFNPPWALKLVEVVRTESTSDESLADALQICERLGRVAIQVKDTPGFVVNRLFVPFVFDAIRLLESGTATAEDIDAGCKLGLNHSMGPLTTADLIGLDTLNLIGDSLFDEYGDSRFKSPTLLRRLVALNHLGRKTGKGFYSY